VHKRHGLDPRISSGTVNPSSLLLPSSLRAIFPIPPPSHPHQVIPPAPPIAPPPVSVPFSMNCLLEIYLFFAGVRFRLVVPPFILNESIGGVPPPCYSEMVPPLPCLRPWIRPLSLLSPRFYGFDGKHFPCPHSWRNRPPVPISLEAVRLPHSHGVKKVVLPFFSYPDLTPAPCKKWLRQQFFT